MKQKTGRPPKPPELRLANGTHRNHRHGPRDAIGTETVLSKVPHIPDKSKRPEFRRRWKQYCSCLIAVGRLTSRDLPVIEGICDAHQHYFDAQEHLKDPAKWYIETASGLARHPAFVTLDRCRKFIADEQPNLGFGPSGRARFPPMVAAGQTSQIQTMNRRI